MNLAVVGSYYLGTEESAAANLSVELDVPGRGPVRKVWTPRIEVADDTVFRCGDESFALVHLTWQAEERPPWPMFERLGSFVGLELLMDQHDH